MEKKQIFTVVLVIVLTVPAMNIAAQDESGNSNFSAGADFYSNYVWRGSKFGTGPAFQPWVDYTSGGFSIGMWGSFDALGYTEADPYISYSFPFGLSLGLTDYYYPGLPVFEMSDSLGSHAFEINAGFGIGGFSVGANYMLNEAGGAGSAGGDMYFELGYDFPNVSLFIGAGDGWHTSDGEFAVCNIGIGTSTEINLSESFALPVSGQIILNPEQEQLYLVVGFSL